MIILTYIIYVLVCAGICSLGFVAYFFIMHSFFRRGKNRESDFAVYEDEIREVLRKGAPSVGALKSSGGMTALVRCTQGREKIKKVFEYKGIGDCHSLITTYRGDLSCPWACLGLGDCAKVCDIGAIFVVNGLARIGSNCTGCGRCVSVCPVGVIDLIPANADYIIPCNSHGGSSTAAVCKTGCTGCGQCEISAGHAGYSVVNNLAVINYNRIGSRSIGCDVCPSKTIVKREDFLNSFVEKKGIWSILIGIESFFKDEK